MVVSEQLKKQIIIEILALLFLMGVIVYAVFAIHKSNNNKVSSVQGMVVVCDDEKMRELEKHSDGEGLELDGVKYTVTNNNEKEVSYDIVVVPNIHDEEVLNNIRISTDDLYVSNLTDLPRLEGGYVISSYKLRSGYTKIHLIKAWYKLGTPDDLLKEKVTFEYHLEKK
jgi:hypothetical protein